MTDTDVLLDLERIERRTLIDSRGRAYLEFRRSLTPRWGVLWSSLIAGHLALITTGILLSRLEQRGPDTIGKAVLVAAGGLVFGYWLHYLLLFQHEGGHYNLAPNRSANDWLANIFIGVIIGEDVRNYRPQHLDHHRYLGTIRDPERNYFDPVDPRIVLESLMGIRVLRTLALRRQLAEETGEMAAGGRSPLLFIGAALNVGVTLGIWKLGYPAVALSWCLGVLMFFPLFNTLRQVLEHRSEFADDNVDYSVTPHGAVNRLFGSGPLASTLGSAGFNRHILHHWDPGISCTRLKDLEMFLSDTELGPQLRKRRTTYLRTFLRLASL